VSDTITTTVRIPMALRPHAEGKSSVKLTGATVSEAMADLTTRFPALRANLCQDDGTLRSFVRLYLNGEDIRQLDGLETALSPGDKLSIIPAIAGGTAGS
jgi:adenylyltransferase/sulfurtransferase